MLDHKKCAALALIVRREGMEGREKAFLRYKSDTEKYFHGAERRGRIWRKA